MASFHTYKAGIQNVGSYQVSGLPWITGSTTLSPDTEYKAEFDNVAKAVTIINDSAEDIRVHYNSVYGDSMNVASGSHFVTLTAARDSVTLTMKCNKIYVSAPATNSSDASFTVIAELTGISKNEMIELTGSGLTTIDGS